MTAPRRLAVTFLLSLVIWAFFSWPLPAHFTEGISSSARSIEERPARWMIPGDHLQLLYHFRLASHFISGKAPLFQNIYEFNTGNDGERYQPGPYYAPFSLIFSLLAPVAGEAAAWNLTGLMSLWLTFWASLLLVRRYASDPWIAWPAALVSILLPYRWISLGGGSPSGFAMMWVPLVFLGLEIMIVDRKVRGGVLAGLAIYFSSWADTHVFFFAVLATPVWLVFSYLYQKDRWVPKREEWAALLKALTPLLASGVLVALQVLATRNKLAGTGMGSAGRPLREVQLFSSPITESLVFWEPSRMSELYLGIVLLVLLTAGFTVALGRAVSQRDQGDRTAAALAALAVMAAAAVVLASGVKGPLGPEGWSSLRSLIPPYAMVRQPAKIYVLLPIVFSVAAALSLKALFRRGPKMTSAGRAAIVTIWALLILDYGTRIDTMVCLLDEHQGRTVPSPPTPPGAAGGRTCSPFPCGRGTPTGHQSISITAPCTGCGW